jgi:outer membrane protein assembly factor BamB
MTARLISVLGLFCIGATAITGEPGSWPQFRGPDGNGNSGATGLPLEWSEESNVKWKTPIHGRGWSSPVIWGGQIWLTTATEDGRELSVLCVDRDTGKVRNDSKLFDVEKPQFAHKFNTYASPTPVIEEGRVYVTFGSPGTACLDTQTAKVLWQRRDFICDHYRGAGSSPILHGNLLLLHFDGSDHQFIAALDKSNGKTVWEVRRSIDFKDLGPDGKPEAEGDFRKAFATPHIALLDGVPQLISQGAKASYGYDPGTGRELWRIEERTSHSASSRPVTGHGLVFLATGWSTGQLLALRPGRNGEVLDANNEEDPEPGRQLNLAWKTKRSVARKPSLLLVEDLLFMIEDGGIATCLEAKSGTEVWRERIGGNYSASPITAEGRIYFFSEEGKTTVIAATREFKKLAENSLADGFMASPAVAGSSLILRTKSHLYQIGTKRS